MAPRSVFWPASSLPGWRREGNNPVHLVLLDRWNSLASPIHRRDPRSKLLALTAIVIFLALSAQFGVSTHVAREAIAALAARGLVQVRHGAGVFVAPRERWQLVDPEIMSLIGGEDRTEGAVRLLRHLLDG